MTRSPLRLFCLLAAVAAPPAAAEAVDAPRLYQENCAACHGADRLGGQGPALLPENLGRLGPKEAERVIQAGRPATQMQGFGHALTTEEIAGLAAFVFSPAAALPPWGMAEIAASRLVHNGLASLPDKPVHGADPLNLFTVVESGDHHVTILDGDRFEPLWRFPSRFALHGGAKYSPDGRFVYLASRDGWIGKYDLFGLKPVAEARAGINTRNIAVSDDGRVVIAANWLPPTIVLLDARELVPLKVIPVADGRGTPSRVSAVYAAPPRRSFIAALKDIPEVWEISYERDPKPVAQGLVHTFEPGREEGAFDRGPFPVRRIKLDETLDDFFFDPPYRHLIGAGRGGREAQVVNLNVGRKIADLELAGMPHLGSGIVFDHDGRPVLATPHLKEGAVSVIDMTTWKTVKRIATLGPGFFMRSHENTPYAWTDGMLGADRDALQIIDKRTLEVARTLRPEPGRTAAHVEFTRDGRHALVSVWEQEGALLVYDAETFEVVKRIPMKKPSGKYNVHNKITRSSGTSH